MTWSRYSTRSRRGCPGAASLSGHRDLQQIGCGPPWRRARPGSSSLTTTPRRPSPLSWKDPLWDLETCAAGTCTGSPFGALPPVSAPRCWIGHRTKPYGAGDLSCAWIALPTTNVFAPTIRPPASSTVAMSRCVERQASAIRRGPGTLVSRYERIAHRRVSASRLTPSRGCCAPDTCAGART